MKLLLDTHALLWWWTDDERLSATARGAMQNPAHVVLVSAASVWEMATKHRLGKLKIAAQALPRLDELVRADGFQHLSVRHDHAMRAGSYAAAHRDPFDRMLAAQGDIEGATLVTLDPAFVMFDTRTLW